MLELEPLGPVVNVYVFVQDGCHFCAAQKEELKTFQQEHPEAFVVIMDETLANHSVAGVSPKSVPAILITKDGKLVDRREGVAKAPQIFRMWKAWSSPNPGVRRRAGGSK